MQNNFNDTINQLKDFNLSPSEQVWKEVESNLDEKKKKRIVVWWWSMPAIILFGIAFYGYYEKINSKASLKSATNNAIKTGENSQINSNIGSKSIISDNIDLKSNSISSLSNKMSIKSNSISSLSNKMSIKSNSISSLSNKMSIKSNSISLLNNKMSLKTNSMSSLSNKMSIKTNSISSLSDSMNTIGDDVMQHEFQTKKHLVENTDVKTLLNPKENDLTNKFADTTSKKIINKKQTSKRGLSWSLAIGGGANYVSRNNVLGQPNESSFYNSGLTSTPSTATASNPSSNILNLPKTGYHFSLGVNVEKPLSKKLSLESGLIYRYVESKIIFQNNSVTNFLSTSSQEYKNNLHLLELPVGLKYCFNPSSKNKLSLLIGGNVAIALKRNWLFINDDLHLYQENSNEINTVLFGLQAGASINFNNKFSLSLVAQKNITSVQKSSSKYYLQQIDFQLNIPFKSLKK